MTDKEKLEKIKMLADKMYSHMMYLTSDTRPIRQAMDEYHQFIINEYHKEEPVSEGLEEEWKRYITSEEYLKDIPGGLPVARHFAKWQKHHMEVNRIKHCNGISKEQAELEQKFLDEHLDKNDRMPTFLDAIEYGIRLQKEQMMKQAIEGVARPDDCEIWCNLDSFNLKDGDKVKIVIV